MPVVNTAIPKVFQKKLTAQTQHAQSNKRRGRQKQTGLPPNKNHSFKTSPTSSWWYVYDLSSHTQDFIVKLATDVERNMRRQRDKLSKDRLSDTSRGLRVLKSYTLSRRSWIKGSHRNSLSMKTQIGQHFTADIFIGFNQKGIRIGPEQIRNGPRGPQTLMGHFG